ncbi:hypothetical protein CGLO_06387 [Colletotrichum gloeosporioides Cg-14]|uniref:Uncharacterized protein n=1 Tax=Colletotrichum gloeosporioides (strain Cg-14) TaxID=1237896 RepID=T0LZA0_COLGC|nr:hypothetical protein CGLO_06387 [Colletotrichum gloeosporioides Cg-14]
MLAKNPIV